MMAALSAPSTSSHLADLQAAIEARDARINELTAACDALKTSERTLTSYAKGLATQLERLEDEKSTAVYLARTSSSRATTALADSSAANRLLAACRTLETEESAARTEMLIRFLNDIMMLAAQRSARDRRDVTAAPTTAASPATSSAVALQQQLTFCLEVIKQLEAEVQHLRRVRDPKSRSVPAAGPQGSSDETRLSVAAVEAESDASKATILALNRQIDSLRRELQMARAEYAAFKPPTTEHESKIAALTRALADRDEALQQQRIDGTRMASVNAALVARLNEAWSARTQLLEAATRQKQDLLDASRRLLLAKEGRNADAVVQGLKDGIVRANARAARLSRLVSTSSTAPSASIPLASSALSVELAQRSARANALNDDFEARIKAAADSLARFAAPNVNAAFDASLRDFERQLKSDLVASEDARMAQMAAVHKERTALVAECDRLIAESTEVEETFHAEMDAKMQIIVDLQQQLADATDVNRTLMDEVSGLRQAASVDAQKREASVRVCVDLITQTDASSFDDAVALAELDDLQERVQALVSAVTASSAAATASESRVEELTSAASAAAASREELEASLAEARALQTQQAVRIEHLVGQVDAAARAAADYHMRIAELNAEIEGLRARPEDSPAALAHFAQQTSFRTPATQDATTEPPPPPLPPVPVVAATPLTPVLEKPRSALQAIEHSILFSLEPTVAQPSPSQQAAYIRELESQIEALRGELLRSTASPPSLPSPHVSEEVRPAAVSSLGLQTSFELLPVDEENRSRGPTIAAHQPDAPEETAAVAAAGDAIRALIPSLSVERRLVINAEPESIAMASTTAETVDPRVVAELEARIEMLQFALKEAAKETAAAQAAVKAHAIESKPVEAVTSVDVDELKAALRRLEGEFAVVVAERDSLMQLLDEQAAAGLDSPVSRRRSQDPTSPPTALSQSLEPLSLPQHASTPAAPPPVLLPSEVAVQHHEAAPTLASEHVEAVERLRAELEGAQMELDLSRRLTDAVSDELSSVRQSFTSFENGISQSQAAAWSTVSDSANAMLEYVSWHTDVVFAELNAYTTTRAAYNDGSHRPLSIVADDAHRADTASELRPYATSVGGSSSAVGVYAYAQRSPPAQSALVESAVSRRGESQSPPSRRSQGGLFVADDHSRGEHSAPSRAPSLDAADPEMFHNITYALGEQAARAADFLFEGRQLQIANTEALQRLLLQHEEDHARDELRQARTNDLASLTKATSQAHIRRVAEDLWLQAQVAARDFENEAADRLQLLRICKDADAGRIRNEAELRAARAESDAIRLRSNLASPVHGATSPNQSHSYSLSTTPRPTPRTPDPSSAQYPLGRLVTLRPSTYASPLRTASPGSQRTPPPQVARPLVGRALDASAASKTPSRRSSSPTPMAFMPSAVHGAAATAEAAGSISAVLHDMAYQRNTTAPAATRRDPPSLNMARAIVIVQQLERQESQSNASGNRGASVADDKGFY